MLFNSFGFILIFLPITLLGYFWIAKYKHVYAASWLGAASIFFYGWWSYKYIPLLLASIMFNYFCGLRISKSGGSVKKTWLTTAIALNLILLGYYKYANFFLSSLGNLTGNPVDLLDIILPIGISFFTFTQIAFLVDTYQGKVKEYRLIHYILFVTYFPHLIAGPVLHHKEMMPQFADPKNYFFSAQNFAVGMSIFCMGLAKKVLIADNIAPYASSVFDAHATPSLLIAWGGVLAYASQLYFDFSGYSDMAIGLSRLFGVRLPLNFNSPYKAVNITEFWRRWHMTLSRFLRDYLYIAMGGSKHGQTRRYFNLMTTMLLGGLWHGAGWNFVIWGGLHGLYLIINHAWIAIFKAAQWRVNSRAWPAFSRLLTFLSVCFAWVFFRASDFMSAIHILQGMIGMNGVALPDAIGNHIGAMARDVLDNMGIVFYLGGGARFLETWGWVVFSVGIIFVMPNTQEIMERYEPALDFSKSKQTDKPPLLLWSPSRLWAMALGLAMIGCLLSLNRPSEFLYFQF
jgi:D-alanyl-lipoteichoic acid acyltransferase DltB (MBOAT superfamily)